MMFKRVVFAGGVFCAMAASAKVELATPFNDGMVLQRDRSVPVWGTATPGNVVKVSFAGAEAVADVSCDGRWKVELPPMAASKESRSLEAKESEPSWFGSIVDTVEISDVLVGEVWMCAGQSNTDCPVWGSSPHYRDGQGVTVMQMTMKPFVRLVKTAKMVSVSPRRDYRAKWIKMTPQTLNYGVDVAFPSAMGYFFALELANSLDIPIGLVDSSWGGTNIDSWTPPSGYEKVPSLKDVAALPRLEKSVFETNAVYKSAAEPGIYRSWIQQPSMLWNGMVAAYAPMACRGLIWYQGCHNSGKTESERYCDKLHALYNGWSVEFANPDLKFYYVQLAPWGHDIARMQEIMARFETEEKNAGMAVINDVGCNTDIHPNDKRTVAKRLALHALKRDYGFDWIVDNSPTPVSCKSDGDKVNVTFRDVRAWYLYNTDWSLTNGFEIAGADGVWKSAQIVNMSPVNKQGRSNGNVRGREIVLKAAEVAEPQRVRYLHASPWKGTLYSEVNLPLGAFELEVAR